MIALLSFVLPIHNVLLNENLLQIFTGANPAVQLLSHALWQDFFVVASIFMLIFSLLFQRLRQKALVYLISVIPLSLFICAKTTPLYLGLFIESAVLLLLVRVFHKRDLLTTMTALYVFVVFDIGFAFQTSGSPALLYSWNALLIVFAVLIALAIYAALTRDSEVDFDNITPVFVRHITERQRMKQELLIARNVQMSFLPSEKPNVNGLDIASRCEPALEVGGDYFDFIELDENRLGVAIGDVSGKGSRAAFYMTLVKGFLRALAGVSYSPAGILVEMNRLFLKPRNGMLS